MEWEAALELPTHLGTAAAACSAGLSCARSSLSTNSGLTGVAGAGLVRGVGVDGAEAGAEPGEFGVAGCILFINLSPSVPLESCRDILEAGWAVVAVQGVTCLAFPVLCPLARRDPARALGGPPSQPRRPLSTRNPASPLRLKYSNTDLQDASLHEGNSATAQPLVCANPLVSSSPRRVKDYGRNRRANIHATWNS